MTAPTRQAAAADSGSEPVCIIPARGGSKRIPDKNIRDFAGRPMIAHAIDIARRSRQFGRIVVSTDSDRIAAVATAHGAEAPFRRPAELSGDTASTMAVLAHAVAWLRTDGWSGEECCALYATTPLLRPEDLAAARRRWLTVATDYAVAVLRYAHPIQRALHLDRDGRVAMVDPGAERTRSQDLAPAWHDAGQFYWGRADAFAAQRPVLTGSAVAIELDRWSAVDIDDEEDWAMAERLHRAAQIPFA